MHELIVFSHGDRVATSIIRYSHPRSYTHLRVSKAFSQFDIFPQPNETYAYPSTTISRKKHIQWKVTTTTFFNHHRDILHFFFM